MGNMTTQPGEGIQAGCIKMYKFHLYCFFVFILLCDERGGTHSSSHTALWCPPMSVRDGHLMGVLKFNTDEI